MSSFHRDFPRHAASGPNVAAIAPDVSIVVPLYDEQENVDPLYEAVTDALAPLSWRYELVLVDDGSKDETFARACALVERDARVRVVGLRRNFGQTAAMAAGIRSARGRTIVTMDGDLQNDPRDIPLLVGLLDDGYDLAAGWRRKRQDEGLRVMISKVANRIINRVLAVQVRDSGCSLKAYRAELIRALPFYGDMHRFIPALSQLAGSRTVQVEVRHHPRRFGKSKYGFARIYRVMLDIASIRFLLSYARHPIASLALPAALLFTLGFIALIMYMFDPRALMVLPSIAILLFAATGFLFCWGLAGLIFWSSEPRMHEFARVGAQMWRMQRSDSGATNGT